MAEQITPESWADAHAAGETNLTYGEAKRQETVSSSDDARTERRASRLPERVAAVKAAILGDVGGTANGHRIDTQRVITTDHSQHRTEVQKGRHVHVNDAQDTRVVTDEDFDSRIRAVVEAEDKERQAIEDERAIRRNRNRLLILIAVLIMELVVPTLYGMHLLPLLFVKYEVLAITLPDALLTVYAYVRRY
jgi:hypothetical protein